MRRLATMILLAGCWGGMAQAELISAQTPAQKKMETAAKTAFKMLLTETDKNHDGKISKVEYFAIMKDRNLAEKNYKFWDLNNDGYITEEEYVKAVSSMARTRK